MAGDVAQLGLAVDSREVAQGAKALDGLTNAAQRAESAADDMGASYANAGKRLSGAAGAAGLFVDKAGKLRNETGQFASAAEKASAAAAGLTNDLNAQAAAAGRAAAASAKASAAANDNGFKTGGHNVSNIAAQFQDVAVSAAGGMSAMQVGLQQGTQLAAVIGTMERPLAGLGAAFLSVLSPLSLAVIGFTTLAAAGIQMVNWAKVGAAALRGLATALQVVAPYAAAVAAALALIYAPAIVSGIASITVAIGRLAVVAVSATAAMAAANPVGAIALGIAAAITAAIAFRDELTKILGVDIVGAAKTGVNYIIGSFVAAFNDIKFIWSNLGDVVGSAIIGATNAVGVALTAMVQSVASRIDRLIAVLNTIPGVSLPEIGQLGGSTPAANPYADRLAKASTSRGAQQQKELNADYLGQFGGAVSSGASAAAGKLRDLANQILQGKDKKSKGKTDAEKYDDIISAADRRIAQLKAEADGLGLTEEAAARLRYETELLNQADQKGIDLSAAQRAELGAKAAAMAQVEAAAKNVKAAYDFTRDSFKGFFSDMRQGLMNGQSAWQSFANAVGNIADKLASKIEDSLADSLTKALFPSGSGGGGLFSSLFSFFGGGTALGQGGIGHAATGGLVRGPGSGTSDTAGLFALSNGEFVMNAAATARNRRVLEAMNSGRVGRMAAGGYVGSGSPANSNARSAPQVTVYNNAPTEVKTEVSDDGRVDIFIEKQVARTLSKTGSEPQRVMRSQFGVKQRAARL